ncbi:MAG TPA: hypothetical protein VII93_01915 [Anaerolineales bacterium]
MPHIGPHFQIARDVSWNDGCLEVFIFSDMSKLGPIFCAMQSIGGAVEDARKPAALSARADAFTCKGETTEQEV